MFAQIDEILTDLSSAEQQLLFPFEHRDRCVRDVLAHLLEWQLMFNSWYAVGMSGSQPAMPAEGFTWRTTPELNAQIWHKYQHVTLRTVRVRLKKSHAAMLKIIDSHSQDELFTKRHYAWTGSTSLGAYLISATSAHYYWAVKLLRKFATAISS